MHFKTIIAAFLLPVLAVQATPVEKRDSSTTVDEGQFVSIIQSAINATATAPITLNVVVPVVVTPTGPMQAVVTALQVGMDQFALDVENKMLPSGVSAFTAVVSSTPILALSKSDGSVVTLAPAGAGAVTTVIASATFLAALPNAAAGVAVSRPLLGGVIGALGLVAGGAMMVL